MFFVTKGHWVVMIQFVFGRPWISLKTGLLSWINIAMFSKLCWPFLNSEIISSVWHTQKHFQDKCSLATPFSCPHMCWQFWFHGNNILRSVHLLVKAGKEFGEQKVWELGYSCYTACQKRERKVGGGRENEKGKEWGNREKERKKNFSIFN